MGEAGGAAEAATQNQKARPASRDKRLTPEEKALGGRRKGEEGDKEREIRRKGKEKRGRDKMGDEEEGEGRREK